MSFGEYSGEIEKDSVVKFLYHPPIFKRFYVNFGFLFGPKLPTYMTTAKYYLGTWSDYKKISEPASVELKDVWFSNLFLPHEFGINIYNKEKIIMSVNLASFYFLPFEAGFKITTSTRTFSRVACHTDPPFLTMFGLDMKYFVISGLFLEPGIKYGRVRYKASYEDAGSLDKCEFDYSYEYTGLMYKLGLGYYFRPIERDRAGGEIKIDYLFWGNISSYRLTGGIQF